MKPAKILLSKIPIVVLMVMAFFSAKPALAQWGKNQGRQMGLGMMGGWGMGWFGGILMIIFWILIVVALVYFIRWLIPSTGRKHIDVAGSNRALEILQERYARGEIDKAKYETMKMDLAK
jgi:putative membrane protein